MGIAYYSTKQTFTSCNSSNIHPFEFNTIESWKKQTNQKGAIQGLKNGIHHFGSRLKQRYIVGLQDHCWAWVEDPLILAYLAAGISGNSNGGWV
jgi:hypothetical protein